MPPTDRRTPPNACQIDAAIRRIERDLAAKPGNAQAHYNLALLLIERNRRNEAVRHLNQALAILPSFAPAAFALGRLAFEANDLLPAARLLQAAASAPALTLDARFVLAEVLTRLHRREEAANLLQWVIAQNPPSPAPYVNLLHLLIDLDPEHASTVADLGVKKFPENPTLQMLQGYILLRRRKPEEAIPPLRRAIGIAPDTPHALGALLQALREAGRWSEEAEAFTAARATLRSRRDVGVPIIPLQAALNFPFSCAELKQIAADTAALNGRHAVPLPPASRPTAPHRPLVIGYLSPDFRDHAIAHVFADTFAAHDPERVRAVAFSLGPDDGSKERREFVASARPFIDLSAMSDQAAAERIRAEGTDILVDLSIATSHHRAGIPAYRPAAIQAIWLGLPSTSGAPWFDYALVDEVVAPEEHAEAFTEVPVRLRHGYHPARRIVPLPKARSRAEENLPEGATVFASFNFHLKIDADSFAAWMEILAAVPGSVLWLRNAPEAARTRYCEFATARGIAPNRLIFASRTERIQDHYARLAHADLMLDCLIYGAHTTCLDALRSGVPMLTVLGETFAARVGASILTHAGLPELVCADRDAFVAEAIRLGTDAGARAALRQKLAASVPASPVFDPAAQARALEDAFEAIWAKRLDA